MQKFALLFICSLACSVVYGQTFTLDISKGYGTGTYQKGDTVLFGRVQRWIRDVLTIGKAQQRNICSKEMNG